MTLVLIEVPNEAAVEILRQNKDIQVVGIVTKPGDAAPAELPTAGPPRKWAGALSTTDADSLRAHLEQVRSEWERDL